MIIGNHWASSPPSQGPPAFWGAREEVGIIWAVRQGLDCCVCCPLPILGPGQPGDGARLHSWQGQVRLLGHHISFFTRYMQVCICERGLQYLCMRGLYPCVCVRAHDCTPVPTCVCMHVHTYATYMYHVHTCIRFGLFSSRSRPRDKDSIAGRRPQIAEQESEEEGEVGKVASEGHGLSELGPWQV